MIESLADVFKKFDVDLPAVAIDYETFYKIGEYSVSDMSYYHYCHDPRFDAYMVSIEADGLLYTGPADDFDWNLLRDYPIWVAHNSPFDRAVHERNQEIGKVPADVNPLTWVNTIDLCAFLRVPRALKRAVKSLYKIDMSKAVREDMDGKNYSQIDDATRKDWLEYAALDSKYALMIWEDHKHKMPRDEHLGSIHTSECVHRGVYVNQEELDAQHSALINAVNKVEREIPWAGEQEYTALGKPRFHKNGSPIEAKPTSTTYLKKYAQSQEIPLPPTTDIKDKGFQDWEAHWGERFPVMKSIQTWRKCNRLVKLYEQIKRNLRPDGRMEFQLKYGGAHTLRWSGSASSREVSGEDEKNLNMQNLLKKAFYLNEVFQLVERETDNCVKIDMRSLFAAPDGKKFCLADASQIEPRILHYLIDDEDFLDRCSQGVSPYEVHASLTMGYKGPQGEMKIEDPQRYALAKARVLALGYGAGWKKFIDMASLYIAPEAFAEIFHKKPLTSNVKKFKSYIAKYAEETSDIFDDLEEVTQFTYVNSWVIVTDYRKNNPRVKKLWDMLGKEFRRAANKDEPYEVELPSGRVMKYMNISKRTQEAVTVQDGTRSKYYGGKLCENIVQACARDYFLTVIINLEMQGYPVIWHVHDEVIAEVDPDVSLDDFESTFTTCPEWMPELPLATEVHLVDHYQK